MPLSYDDDHRARLELNARSFRPDPVLDHAADLFFSDRAAWDRLPGSVKAQTDIYLDLRQAHRDAVEAGVYVRPHDRGPAA